MTADRITVRRLSVADLPAVERIYVDAIPATERKPLAWLRSLADPPPTYAALVAADAHDTPIGFAVLFVPASAADAALLEYMAVAEAARNGGVGGRLFAEAIRLAGRPVLVEVKVDDANANRRQAFYRRHGCELIERLRYVCPLPDAPPMRLMVGGAFDPSDLPRWLSTVYAEVYGQRRDHPRLAAMAAELNGFVPADSPDPPGVGCGGSGLDRGGMNFPGSTRPF